MAIDLARAGFAFPYQWYRNIFEDGNAFGEAPGSFAAQDFLAPLSRLAAGQFVLEGIEPHDDDLGVSFRLGGERFEIRFPEWSDAGDLELVDGLVTEVNRALAKKGVGYQFALAVLPRMRLRGVLIPDGELASLAGSELIRMPRERSAWRPTPAAPSVPVPFQANPSDIVGDRVFSEDAESIDDATGLEHLVRRLAALGGELRFDEVTCVRERDSFALAVRSGQQSWRARLAADGWVDVPALTELLNRSLADRALPRRLVELRTDDQSFAVALAGPDEQAALVNQGHVVVR